MAAPKVTAPGPLTWLQVVVKLGGVGKPSSLTVPSRFALAGAVIVWSNPAFTTGAVFAAGGDTHAALPESVKVWPGIETNSQV